MTEYDALRAVYEAARKYLRNEAEFVQAAAARAELDYAIEDVKLIDGGLAEEADDNQDEDAIVRGPGFYIGKKGQLMFAD